MSHVCTACKATEFDETEDGALVCVECGTQAYGRRVELNGAVLRSAFCTVRLTAAALG